jgi:hypothetical protein
MIKRQSFPDIVRDNEDAIAQAIADGRNIEAFLLFHGLLESLLRRFLKIDGDVRFIDLIRRYSDFLKSEGQTNSGFVDELIKFNQRRNRIIHQLWWRGYSETNTRTRQAVNAAHLMYGLFIEWLETFDPNIVEAGLERDC